MAETKSRSIRVEDAVWEGFCALPGTQNEAMRRLLERAKEVENGPGLLQKTYERAGRIENMLEELLEMGMSVAPASSGLPPGRFDPATIPGVQQGAPKRETGFERAERERRERQERARSLDKTGRERDDIDRSDEYVSN